MKCPDCGSARVRDWWVRYRRIDPNKRVHLNKCADCPSFWCDRVSRLGRVRESVPLKIVGLRDAFGGVVVEAVHASIDHALRR